MAQEVSSEQIAVWVELLSGAGRRARQDAAHELAQVAQVNPRLVAPHTDALVDALFRPEALTRWEALSALVALPKINDAYVVRAVEGAEASLFDEGSSTVRLAAFRLLAKLGATAPEYSDQAWPLLDEAVQCFHGDPEYRDMLVALVGFAGGNISDGARAGLIARLSFDAERGHGIIKPISAQVIDVANGAEPVL